MAGLRAVLPLFLLCCLLAAIASVSADSKHKEPHRSRGHIEMKHHRSRSQHLPRHRPRFNHGSRHRPRFHHGSQHRPRFHHGGRHRRRHRVRVRTACHGRTLRLGCHRGYKIRVLGAFYGRFSGRICPKLRFKRGHRKRHRKVARCSAKNSRAKARRLCQGKGHCRLAAKSKIFGKPCSPKERPYLRVRYTCVFQACKRVVWLQAKLVQLIGRYGELAKHSYGYWRRRHFRDRSLRLKRKLNRLRRQFHFCFKCRRGCGRIRKLLAGIKRAETRVRDLLKKLAARKASATKKGHKTHASRRRRMRWHAGRRFLKRKLAYMRARRRMLSRKLRRCKRVCHY